MIKINTLIRTQEDEKSKAKVLKESETKLNQMIENLNSQIKNLSTEKENLTSDKLSLVESIA